MKYVIRVVLCLVVILVTTTIAVYLHFSPERQSDPVASEATQITLDTGAIVGYQNSLGVSVWQGIPYARASD
jgi:hypothetical protein